MEFLNIKSLIILLFLAIVPMATAQINPSQVFSDSYSYEASGDYQKAIGVLQSVSGYDYHKSLRLGWLYYLSKDYETSKKHYRSAIQLAPKAVEALLGLCYPLEAQKKGDELEKVYKQILTLDKMNSKVNYALGNIYYYRKDFQQAEIYFELVQAMYPFDYYSTLMTAWTKYFLGKKSDAKRLFNTVLIISPADQSAKDGLKLLK
ncbi:MULTISPECIES: tetratricopeptide repeat protein [Proteiniphilum]|jgi:tetratricopeptide (TPR) repeat protein|uniref:tetratricopeptide repeat protein n=1 Tax=Proteiniphilum TaxID=294702 RepID=UPI001EEB757C|nr:MULTISPECIES: tetratricopeptide repeat protein [Proteiniphilum]ULB35778.1 tetratricopeptide repeat protein [Proteiniphilum propionicum]